MENVDCATTGTCGATRPRARASFVSSYSRALQGALVAGGVSDGQPNHDIWFFPLDGVPVEVTPSAVNSLVCAQCSAAGSLGTIRALAYSNRDAAMWIVDEILDVEGSLAELGKSAGSDERKKKATYPAIHGLDVSKQKARTLIEEAKRLLEPLGAPALPIRALADFVLERRS